MMTDRTAIKVGIASFIMTICIALLLIWKSSVFLRVTGYELVGEFQTVNGLLNGSEVRYRGIKVGKVFSINPSPEHIRVYFRINSDIQVPKGSLAKVIFDGLIGEKFLAIQPDPDSKEVLKDGDIIYGYASSGLSDFIEVGTENLEGIQQVVDTFRRVFGAEGMESTMGNIVENVEAITAQLAEISEANKLENMVESFEQFSTSLALVVDRLNEQVLTDEVATNINESAKNFALFSTKINSFSDRIEQFLLGDEAQDPSAAMNLFRTITTMRIKPGVQLQYSQEEKLSNYLVNMDWDFGNSYFRTGIGDRLEEKSQLLNFQYGWDLTADFLMETPWTLDYLSTRMGLFYAKPGIGIDIGAMDRLLFEIEFYNFNKMELDLTTKLRIIQQLNAVFNIRKNPKKTNAFDHYSLGISYYY